MNRPSRQADRRHFLKQIGIGAAGLGLLPSVVTRAAGGEAPVRFIAMFTANGTIFDKWAQEGTGPKDFTLGPILQPLAAFKDRLVLLQGLDNLASYDGPGAAHQKGAGAFLTGAPLNDGEFTGGGNSISGWASGISVDQKIANAISEQTPLKSLELGVQVEGSNNRHRIAYAGSDKPLPPDDDPASVFERLFGNFAQTEAQQKAIARKLRRRQSVLDHVESDLTRLQKKLGKDEWENLQAHVDSIRDIEKRLEMPTETCELPSVPNLDHTKLDNYEQVGDTQMELIASAFACDLTRVATVLWGGATSGKRFPWLGISDSHHSLSHEGSSNTTAKNALTKIDQWYAARLAHLMEKLDAIPEGNGTVLDNTVILWGNGLSIGNTHSRKNLHWVLAGGAGGAWQTGRYYKCGGAGHNDLLTSIANAMGLGLSSFGPAKYCNGPLSVLT